MYILSKLRYRYSNMVRAELQLAAVAQRSSILTRILSNAEELLRYKRSRSTCIVVI